MYVIIYEKLAKRQLKKLPKQIAQRIEERIGELADEPRPNGCLKLTGQESYRIRVGDYRIIYEIEDDILTVLVVKIGHRRDVYE